MSKTCIDRRIKNILRNFDFDKVNKIMRMLGWEWWDTGVPSIDMLKRESKRLLRDTVQSGCDTNDMSIHSTGGLMAIYHPQTGVLELSFALESWRSASP